MKRIIVLAVVALFLSVAVGLNFVVATDDAVKQGEEMIKVSEIVEEGSEKAKEGDELLKEGEMLKKDESAAVQDKMDEVRKIPETKK